MYSKTNILVVEEEEEEDHPQIIIFFNSSVGLLCGARKIFPLLVFGQVKSRAQSFVSQVLAIFVYAFHIFII